LVIVYDMANLTQETSFIFFSFTPLECFAM